MMGCNFHLPAPTIFGYEAVALEEESKPSSRTSSLFTKGLGGFSFYQSIMYNTVHVPWSAIVAFAVLILVFTRILTQSRRFTRVKHSGKKFRRFSLA